MSAIDKNQYPDLFDVKRFEAFNPGAVDNHDLDWFHDKDIYIDSVWIKYGTAAGSTSVAGLGWSAPHATLDTSTEDEFITMIATGRDMNTTTDTWVEVTMESGGAAASGQIECLDATPGNYTGDTLEITDAQGTKKTYKFSTSGAAGDINADHTINVVAATDATGVAAAIKAAVEHANGHNGTLTATVSTAKVTLLNTIKSAGGNSTVLAPKIVTSDAADTRINEQFGGGRDQGHEGFVPQGSTLLLVGTANLPATLDEVEVFFRYRERSS